jgi:SAM-dependent methyltransferase
MSEALASGPRYHGIFRQLRDLNIYGEHSEDLYGAELSGFYDRFVGEFVGDVPVFQKWLEGRGDRILDLACGSGRIGIAMARLGVRVDGLELSRAMLDRAEQHVANESAEVAARLRFIQGDMSNFELGERYGLVVLGVTSISLLLSEQQRLGLFKCVHRHLGPSGRFVFDIMDFAEGRWQQFDNFQEVWSREGDDGQDFAIVGQKFYPEERVFCFNVYQERVGWGGETTRTIGYSTKAWLDREELLESMQASGLELVEDFRLGQTRYFVAKRAGEP